MLTNERTNYQTDTTDHNTSLADVKQRHTRYNRRELSTPLGEVNTPPQLSYDTPGLNQLISHRGGVECYFYSPHLWLLQQSFNIALIRHNKHDRNVVNNFSVEQMWHYISASVGFDRSTQTPTGAPLLDPAGDFHPPDFLTQLDTPTIKSSKHPG